jgi:hypothetical protein
LRLPLELKDLEWLETHQPLRASHVFGLLTDARGGKVIGRSSAYASRAALPPGPQAERLEQGDTGLGDKLASPARFRPLSNQPLLRR